MGFILGFVAGGVFTSILVAVVCVGLEATAYGKYTDDKKKQKRGAR